MVYNIIRNDTVRADIGDLLRLYHKYKNKKSEYLHN